MKKAIVDLSGTPYSLARAASQSLARDICELEERMALLREEGVTDETLHSYYGARRFEQVAESNAIEGSTLGVGETEVAVLKGVTLTGHDPKYQRDAINLNNALEQLVEFARDRSATDIAQLHRLHNLILGAGPGAGVFRKDRVRISGSEHVPPKTWDEVVRQMEAWESWSKGRVDAPALVRAAILHAWLVHIHPFVDGNGRAARAIMNLELVRAGYPPIIIKRKDRERYVEALAESDTAGNIAPFFDLLLTRARGALLGLELAARKEQGYDPVETRLRKAQQQTLAIWNQSVALLYEMITHQLDAHVQRLGGDVDGHLYRDALELEDYVTLCSRRPVGRSWGFRISCRVPGLPPVKRLAWAGYRDEELRVAMDGLDTGGPAIFWSRPNTERYPPWIKATRDAPRLEELTTIQGRGDTWFAKDIDGAIHEGLSTSQVVDLIVAGFVDLLAPDSSVEG